MLEESRVKLRRTMNSTVLNGSRHFGRMLTGLFAVTVMTGALCAQSNGREGQADRAREPEQDAMDQVRRLESVSWNPVTGELTWIVSKGKKVSGVFNAAAKDTYIIRIDEALMKFEGERRGFDPEEAKNVHGLLDLLSRYAVESTIWWEKGQGVKMDERQLGVRAAVRPGAEQGAVKVTLTAAHQ